MSDSWFDEKATQYAAEAGLLAAVESFLRGLPNEVRNKLTAGELADTVVNISDDVRKKRRDQQ